MTYSLEELIENMGPEVMPFERNEEPTKKPAAEEVIDFSIYTYNAIKDDSPEPNTHHINIEEEKILPKEKMFIWLIYKRKDELCFRLIPDNFENRAGKNKVGGRPNVCHSNISAGGKALQGGECWWCEATKTMYVNYKSGRYGAKTTYQWEAVLKFFEYVGYKKVKPIIPKGWKLKN